MKAFQGWRDNVGGCKRSSALHLDRKGSERIVISGENKIIAKGVLYLDT